MANSHLMAGTEIPEILVNESAPSARAAMGIFANGYSKTLSGELLGFKKYSLEDRFSNVVLAAVGYQILSYNTQTGLELKPFKLNKEWKGYWTGFLVGEGIDLFLYWVNRYKDAQYIVASTIIMSMAIIVVVGESQGGFRMSDDGPLNIKNLFTNRHSYWVHFAGSGGLYWAISNHTASEERSLFYTTMMIWLWEIKDGYLKWEDYGYIGGDGFSWRDGTAGTVAAVGSYAFDKWGIPFIKGLFGKSLHKIFLNVNPNTDAFRVGLYINF